MTPETQIAIKVVAGTVLIFSLIIGFLERWFRPSYLMLEDSRSFPSWIGWLGWILATLAALAYVLVDFLA
jgi:protein-S-isoprenylcysteine O-methyltransferase Ste14